MSGRVRGTMTSMNVLFGSLGSAAFALIAGILFDKIAPWAPFMVVAAGDFTVFFFSVIFLACGLISRSD